VHDEDTDEVSAVEDEQANKDFYARAFNEWAKGNIAETLRIFLTP